MNLRDKQKMKLGGRVGKDNNRGVVGGAKPST